MGIKEISRSSAMNAHVEAFFDPATYTYSYVVSDPATG